MNEEMNIGMSAVPFSDGFNVTAFYTRRGISGWRYGEYRTEECAAALAEKLHITPERMVSGKQIHSTVVRRVSEADGGNGILRPSEWEGDGLITDCRGLLLCTREADCLPVFLYDPVTPAVGMVHSGWRGTAACVSAEAVRRMGEEFGTLPENVLVAFGPCICAGCYEVGGELLPAFAEHFTPEEISALFTPKRNGKYLLNLQKAAAVSLQKAGVPEENIAFNPECTYHSGRYDSYRLTHSLDCEMLTAIMLP